MEKLNELTMKEFLPSSSAVLALFFVFIMMTFESASAQVKEGWVVPYDGLMPTAIAVDVAGNVYVTGGSYGAKYYYYKFNESDYVTIKYDTSGNELWLTRYNGPDNLSDSATALAVDAAGNVYVTGTSDASDTGLDYVTIKYDTSGNELWVARYNGPGNFYDSATALAVDTAGNVYVTGQSYGTTGDYTTIKYDTSGNELWVARYNGPDNRTDRATALAVDLAGNVYVTGIISFIDGTIIGPPLDSYADYATIKYDTSGNELWVAIHKSGNELNLMIPVLALDASDNVYVTAGDLFGKRVTIKLVPNISENGGGIDWSDGGDGGDGGGCFITTIRK